MDANVSYAASYHFLNFLFEIPVTYQIPNERTITVSRLISYQYSVMRNDDYIRELDVA